MADIQNIAQESVKVARVVIPSEGYDSKIAKADKTGFVEWLQYANEWKQISDRQLEEFLDLYNEAHEKILAMEKESLSANFYSKLATWTALGVGKALGKIKLVLIKIISTYCKLKKFNLIFHQATMINIIFKVHLFQMPFNNIITHE